jgi:transmembrane sensor
MESREQVEEAAATWIARRDTGPWSAADVAEFETWLAESPGRRAAYYRLNAAWQDAGRLRALGAATGGLRMACDSNKPSSAGRLGAADEPGELGELREPSVSARRLPLLAARRLRASPNRLKPIAAVVLLAVLAGLLFVENDYFNPDRYSTGVGGLEAVPVPDGSRVTLNTDSRVRIRFNEKERLVDLERGEAFFEVAKDPHRPFIVRAGNRRVVAVGTQFSVRREGDDVRVVVSEGTVRMDPGATHASENATAAPLLLAAGSEVRAEAGSVLVQKKSIPEIEQRLTWRAGLLTFRDTPLAEAAAEFNRYNSRKIVIEGPDIATLEVGGIFRSNNLDLFVRLLEQGFPVRATVTGDRIVLTAK